MKIVIPGGTGQVGQILTRAFVRDGHEVVVLSRNAQPASQVRIVWWHAKSPGAWTARVGI